MNPELQDNDPAFRRGSNACVIIVLRITMLVTRNIAQIAIIVPNMTVLVLGDAIALLVIVPALIDTSVLDLPMITPIQTPETLVPF